MSTSGMSTGGVTWQEGAPYPADMEHLEEILSIPPGNALPEGAQVLSVSPAVKFAEYYEGGWGYVIAFTAEEHAILNYIDMKTSAGSIAIDRYAVSDPNNSDLLDIQLEDISRPWDIGFNMNATFVLERPLGRGWLQIRGAPR